MKIKNIILALLAIVSLPCIAQEGPTKDSYYMRVGVDAMDEGRYREAYQTFDKELESNATNGYAYSLQGDCFKASEMYGPALGRYALAVKNLSRKDKELVRVYGNMAFCYANLEMYDEAIAQSKLAISLGGDCSNWYIAAYSASCNNDNKSAVEYARNGIKALASGDEVSHMVMMCQMLADVGVREKDKALVAEGLAAFRKFIGKAEQSADKEALIDACSQMLKYVAYVEGEATAVDEFLKLYKLVCAESLRVGMTNPLTALMQKGTFAELICERIDELGADPRNAYDKILILSACHKYRQAAEMVDKVCEAYPDWTFGNSVRLDQYKLGGATDLYLDLARRVLAKGEAHDSLALLMDVVEMEIDDERWGNALDDVEMCIAEWPNMSYLYKLRGVIRLYTGDLDAAQADCFLAKRIYPQLSVAYLNLAAVYNAKGETDKANAEYRELLARKNVQAQYRALAAAHLGDRNELDKALEEMKDTRDNHYNLAAIASILRDKQEALKQLRLVVESGAWSSGPKCMKHDTDFGWLRSDPEFQAIVADYERRVEAAWK